MSIVFSFSLTAACQPHPLPPPPSALRSSPSWRRWSTGWCCHLPLPHKLKPPPPPLRSSPSWRRWSTGWCCHVVFLFLIISSHPKLNHLHIAHLTAVCSGTDLARFRCGSHGSKPKENLIISRASLGLEQRPLLNGRIHLHF